MKNTGLKNEQLITELIRSGSTAIKTKNEFGVHIFSGSVDNDGVISSKLIKPKYNKEEVEKSIDTSIIELIPLTTPEPPDTVLRSIHNIALAQIDDLTNEVTVLNGVIITLQSNITELEIVTQSLRIELDGKDLLLAAEANQTQQATLRVQSSIGDLQNSIQRTTNEAIQRVSLTARNEALIQEVESIRFQLQTTEDRLDQTIRELTKEASLGAELANGAFGGTDITVKPTPISDTSISPIAWRGRPRGNYRDGKFINGNTLSIFNATDDSITVKFVSTKDFLNRIPDQTVQPKSFSNVTLNVDVKKIDGFKRGIRDQVIQGELSISTPNTTLSMPIELQIQRGKNYRRPS